MLRGLKVELEDRLGRLAELMALGESLLEHEYLKVLKGEDVNVYLIEKLVNRIRKNLAESMAILEKLQRLKEETDEQEAVADRIAWMIFSLDERGRNRVAKVIDEEFVRVKLKEKMEGEYDLIVERLQKRSEDIRMLIEQAGLDSLLNDVASPGDLFFLICGAGRIKDIWLRKAEESDRLVAVAIVEFETSEMIVKLREHELWWDVVRKYGKQWIEAEAPLSI